METLFVVTGLAQWAGTRIRSGSRIRRVPGSIPGTRVICYHMFGAFFNILGDAWDKFSDICLDCFGHVWECFGDLLGPFGIGLG